MSAQRFAAHLRPRAKHDDTTGGWPRGEQPTGRPAATNHRTPPTAAVWCSRWLAQAERRLRIATFARARPCPGPLSISIQFPAAPAAKGRTTLEPTCSLAAADLETFLANYRPGDAGLGEATGDATRCLCERRSDDADKTRRCAAAKYFAKKECL
jgi:hypothetical protein